jgi:hypothetical protein
MKHKRTQDAPTQRLDTQHVEATSGASRAARGSTEALTAHRAGEDAWQEKTSQPRGMNKLATRHVCQHVMGPPHVVTLNFFRLGTISIC